MGTYPWDGHIGCFRGIYIVRHQVLFCRVCIHLRGRPQKKIRNKNWDVTRTFGKSLAVEKGTSICNMWESRWDSSYSHQDLQSQNSRSARCATHNERRTMNGHFSKNNWDGHMSLRRYGDLQTSLWASGTHSVHFITVGICRVRV